MAITCRNNYRVFSFFKAILTQKRCKPAKMASTPDPQIRPKRRGFLIGISVAGCHTTYILPVYEATITPRWTHQ